MMDITQNLAPGTKYLLLTVKTKAVFESNILQKCSFLELQQFLDLLGVVKIQFIGCCENSMLVMI